MSKKIKRIATLAGAVALTGAGLVLFGMPGHAQSGPPQKDMTVDKAMRSEVVESIITNLNQSYVFPDKAAAIGKSLRAQLQHGDFDGITGARIPRHPGFPLPDLECPKPTYLNVMLLS